MHRVLTRTVAATAVAVLAIAGFGGVATAGGRGTAQVDGLLEPDQDNSCNNPDHASGLGTYDVTGGLVGCWYTDTFEVDNESPSGAFTSHGTETFIGCLGTTSTCGEFYTTFTFTAKFVGDVEAHGRCHHPIVGGKDAFANASGVISMHDLPNGCATYRGHVTL